MEFMVARAEQIEANENVEEVNDDPQTTIE